MTQKADSQWILLRGLARESRHWGTFPLELTKALSKNGGTPRVDLIDLPGTGRFSEMRSPLTIREITSFAREKYLEIRRKSREQGDVPASKCYLVAMSLGGMVACDWIERFPHDFAGLVLINTSFKGFSPIHHRLSHEALVHFGKILATRDPIERERRVLAMISNRPEIFEETAREWAGIQMSRPVSVENFARQLAAAALYQPRLPKPSVPSLVLNAQRDRMVNPSCSVEIAKRWESTFVRHPSAGHDLTLDDGPWTAQAISAWSLDVLKSQEQGAKAAP